jgi:hypothetical protein
MLKLLATAALASAFVLSCATITPVSAQGHGMRYHNNGGGHYRFQAQRPAMRTFKPILRPHHPIHVRPIHSRQGSGWHGRLVSHARYGSNVHWRHGSHWRLYSHRRYGSAWGYPVPIPVPTGVGVATYAAPVSGCTCLIKEYLEDGSVRFTDTCTKEFAVSPPPAPVQGPAQ